jgi:iron(III) transport system ATP-binding protein
MSRLADREAVARSLDSAALACRDLAVGYGDVPVLADVDLTVARGEVLGLLGPSGSGKTTLLHAVAGFVAPIAGCIWLSGHQVSAPGSVLPPERRGVGMVFQTYALWPHMSALQTVVYPLRRRGVGRAEASQRAHELLSLVGIADRAQYRPHEMSGGEQQRVGLARALARDPALYLFDEPTAHLDAHLRATVLEEVARQRAATGAAALYATHEAAEALAIASKVAVVHGGRLAQLGTPQDIYARPLDLTIAGLTGTASTITADVRPVAPDMIEVAMGGVRSLVPCDNAASARAGSVTLIRPDWARLGGELPGQVTAVRYRGAHSDYHLATPAGGVVIREPGPPRLATGTGAPWSLRKAWLIAA